MDKRLEVEEAEASFRGVPFHVLKRNRGGGRRGPCHEAPQRDEPDGEDLGRKVRVFRVEGLIIGQGDSDEACAADCARRVAALLEAFEDVPGPGTYRDPWHKDWQVICRSYDLSDDQDRQFVSVFSAVFEESGDTRYPLSREDTATGVETAADEMSEVSANSLLKTLSVKGRPQYVLDAAKGFAIGAASTLSGTSLTQLDTSSAIGVVDAGSEWQRFTGSLPGSLTSGLIGDGLSRLFRAFSGGSYHRRAGLGDAGAARTAFAGLSSFGSDAPVIQPVTASRAAQAQNQSAMIAVVRRMAVAEEARALAATSWDSHDQAQSQRDATVARIDVVMIEAGRVGDDDVYGAARALREAVIRDVAARAPSARVRTATFDVVLPARVIAHRLLGDGRKADDLVKRNGISNPAFVPAGRPLEYLDG
ncbi:DNA circularization protein [Magnetospirillum fulvum]|uniref:DNA circulation family protein n=1 Tax=Magnetospirillum fulvum MGU-K5 TaxID=1316936 RepID=S9TGG3_MAGFU|nr:DNA circularization N-terminal domain-containing protein [Magnetospirillum fulvum]EPY01376.1 DNA circulation family protein [Magnetospirillum fulvum MGU-K5]